MSISSFVQSGSNSRQGFFNQVQFRRVLSILACSFFKALMLCGSRMGFRVWNTNPQSAMRLDVHHVCVSFFIIIIILCNFALRFTCEFMFLIVCSEGLSSSRSFLQWTNTNELGMHWTSSVCTHGWFLFSAYWFIGFLITDAVGHKLWKGNHKPSMSHI